MSMGFRLPRVAVGLNPRAALLVTQKGVRQETKGQAGPNDRYTRPNKIHRDNRYNSCNDTGKACNDSTNTCSTYQSINSPFAHDSPFLSLSDTARYRC